MQLKKIDVAYEGKQVAAQEITVFPYKDDPLKERFGKFGDKSYVFIISDAVPGSLYRVYTTFKADKPTPVVDSSMTIAKGDALSLNKSGLVAQKR